MEAKSGCGAASLNLILNSIKEHLCKVKLEVLGSLCYDHWGCFRQMLVTPKQKAKTRGSAMARQSGLELTGQQQRRRALLGTYKMINGELADLTWTLSELEQQLGTLEHEAAEEGAPELRQRLQDLRRWQSTLEERILRHMYRADELWAEIERLKQE